MENDDIFFATPELDVFPSEIQELVLSTYTATIEGIEFLDREERERFHKQDADSEPVLQQQLEWWEDQVQRLQCHAGNIGLVSLILLFDNWLARRVKRGTMRDRFKELVGQLTETPITIQELEDMLTARDSIIHHRGKAEFKDREAIRRVNERFLDSDTSIGIGRVAVDKALLTQLADKVVSLVNLLNGHRHLS